MMDCCNTNYQQHRYHHHHPGYYPASPHYHPAMGYFPAPPMAGYEPSQPAAYHHASDYYSHHHHHHHQMHCEPSAVGASADYHSNGAGYSVGNAPFHMSSYYHHMNGWSGAPTHSQPPDYVYNPKEARIRKAIRDATREKIMSATAGMAPNGNSHQRPTQRRPAQPWMLPDHDEQIMMSPGEPGGVGGGALRAGMASPMCGTGFPMGMAPMGPMSSSYPAQMHHPHAAYMNNPLAQLQHQTDLWNPYHHKNQTKSPQDAAYLMSHHQNHMSMSPYAHIPPILFSPTPTPPPNNQQQPTNENKMADDQLMTNTSPPHSSEMTKDKSQQENNTHKTTLLLRTAKMEQPDTPPPSEQDSQSLILNDVVDEQHIEQQHQQQQQMNGCSSMELEQQLRHNNGRVEMTVDYNGGGGGDHVVGMVKVAPTMSSTSITREGYQQQEKIVLQNPFDMPASSSSHNMMTTFNQHQQQRKKQKVMAPPPSLNPSNSIYNCSNSVPTSFSYSISDIELRKHFILKYAQNYNYDHMELMLQQPINSSSAVPARAISYHYVTLPITNSMANTMYYPAGPSGNNPSVLSTNKSQTINIGSDNKEMYLIPQGTGTLGLGQVIQPGQALNLSADLK